MNFSLHSSVTLFLSYLFILNIPVHFVFDKFSKFNFLGQRSLLSNEKILSLPFSLRLFLHTRSPSTSCSKRPSKKSVTENSAKTSSLSSSPYYRYTPLPFSKKASINVSSISSRVRLQFPPETCAWKGGEGSIRFAPRI